MIKSIFLSSAEPYSGKSLVTLGVFETILRRTPKVAFFKPIIRDQPEGGTDKNIELIKTRYNLSQTFEQSFAYYRTEAQKLIGHGKIDEFVETILLKYKALEEENDFVIVEGSDYIGEGSYFEFDINALVAKNLGLPTLIIGLGKGRSMEEILNPITMAVETFSHQDTKILGVVINRVLPERTQELLKEMKKQLPRNSGFHSVIPMDPVLSSPTLREVADQLGAHVLFGEDKLDNLAMAFQSVAMQLNNYLKVMKDGSVAITPGDRLDILMGALQANSSRNFPSISGMVLTGGYDPPKEVFKLLEGLPDVFPVLSVKEYTFQTSVNAGNIASSISTESERKINLALELFDKHVDLEAFNESVVSTQAAGMTPKMFIYHLQKLASQNKKRIVLPEGTDDRVLKAIEILQKKDVVDMVVLGHEEDIKNKAKSLGLLIDFNKTPIIDPTNTEKSEAYSQELYELRKSKGVSLEMATDLMTDVSYFGTMMVHKGEADGMVSGAAHTTQHTIRPALQFIKTKPGYNVVSSVFFMCLEDRVVAYGDCAVNPNPTSEELAEIAIASAETTKRFGIEPKVALLSYSSGESGKGAEVDKVRNATKIFKEKAPQFKVEGPIQYDAAVDASVGKKKLPNSEVAGQASVLVFPDLNTGNNTYKAVQRETGAIAIGPVLQGLNKPVNDLSRGCLVEDIVNTVIITAIQAQEG
ncbi:MAG: phosphate acetyltransferase [Cyclobacteriaceae bacterium]|nr:phosphate acetyltransferase [Cyclobacteriaceae bacterium]